MGDRESPDDIPEIIPGPGWKNPDAEPQDSARKQPDLLQFRQHRFRPAQQLDEGTWDRCDHIPSMLQYLTGIRKQRLFAAACCRPRNPGTWLVNWIEDHADRATVDDPWDQFDTKFVKVGDDLRFAGAPAREFRPGKAAGVIMLLSELDGTFEAEQVRQLALIRCLMGNPFRPVSVDPSWLTSTVMQLAQGIYEDRAFDRMPILADALQDAGCDNDDVLNHCRDTNTPHARGCWVVDLVLGKG